MEEFQFSDSESDKSCDLYGDDPVFETKEDLEEFLQSCDIQRGKQDVDEHICFDQVQGIAKECTCGRCEDIWSGDFEHLCCQQNTK